MYLHVMGTYSHERTLSGLNEKMPPHGRPGAGSTRTGCSTCPKSRDVFLLQVLQRQWLLKSMFPFKVSSGHTSSEWNCKRGPPLLLLALLSCVPVLAKQHGILVHFPLDDAQLAQNRTSAFHLESEKLLRTANAAPIISPDLLFRKEEERSDVGQRAEKLPEDRKRRHHSPTVVEVSGDRRQEQEKKILGASSKESSKLSSNGDVRGSIDSQVPADPAATSPNVSAPTFTRIPSESPSPPQTSTTAAPAISRVRLSWSVAPPANETPPTSVFDSSSSSKMHTPVAPAPRESSSPFRFTLQEALRFPASLLSPLRAAFAPDTPPPEKTSPSPSHAEVSARHLAFRDTQQTSSGEEIDGAQLLRASLRWSNSLAKDIQKRILEFTGNKSPETHVNKGLLRLVGNIRRTFSGRSDPWREVEESKGDVPAGGGDAARKAKKSLPPFDKQTRKHMSYVREWFTVSVGATMNGMRDQDEDALIVSAALENFPNARMFSLFDGHAGQEAARRCSANASRIFGQLTGLSPAALKQACLELDERIRNYPGPCLKSGSTGVIAIVNAVEMPSGTFFNIHMANVGDSRAFLLHMSDDTYEILTRDHKPNQVEELQRIQKAGGCVRRIHKRVWRVNGFLALSRSFGDFALKRVASKTPEEQQVIAVPGVSTATARPGDYLLLGCDGVFEGEGMSWDFVARLLKESIVFFGGDIAATVNHLIDIAFALGSRDNISILLIKFTNRILTPQVKRFEIEVDGTARELPVEILPGQDISTSTAGVYKRDHSLLVTLFS